MMNRRILSLWFALCLILPKLQAQQKNEKPFVIPELKEWVSGTGEFTIDSQTQISIPKGDVALRQVAEAFAADLQELVGLKLAVIEGKTKAKSISLGIQKDKNLGEEGYQITIGNQLQVRAAQTIGIYWATRTLLQLAEQMDNKLPQGRIRDFPDYPLRGFMLDCGRKFIPMDFLRDYVKVMSYYKMNTFQIHLNDNGFDRFFENDWDKTYAAFRLESETFPGLAAEDGYYSKQEFIDLQKLAESKFVTIIPEIDVPAHSLAFTHYLPEIGSKEYGMDHLDLFKPETYDFIDKLFKEYLEGDEPVFRGELVHVGTDEYSNEDQEVVEKFRYFTDYCIRLVESYGKKAAVWGALTHAQGTTPVKSEDVLMLTWHNPYAQPDDMMEQGYDVVSIPDGLLYIVPNAGYYYDYLNIEHLYNKWTPATIGDKTFAERHPQIKGGMFAVWNDHVGNGISTKDIHHRVMPAMQTLAVKMWTGEHTKLPFALFNEQRVFLSEAPGVNQLGRVGGLEPQLVYEKSAVVSGSQTGITEIGYDYTVSFELDGRAEKRGTILFASPTAEFYLSDPIKGMLGFSRDGYLNTFNYRVKEGERVHISIQGNNKLTRLYINGQLKEELGVRLMEHNGGKSPMYYSNTLVFPLEQAGEFKSKISDLKVYNYWIKD